VLVFNDTHDGQGTAAFECWMRPHPNAYYVNEMSPLEFLLHHANCWHMVFGDPVNTENTARWSGLNSRLGPVSSVSNYDIVRILSPRASQEE